METAKENEQYYYLASFRVSNQHYCFHPADRQRMAGGTPTQKSKQVGRDYLGLAVLDGNWRVRMDTVVDLKAAGFAGAQDFRLFVLNQQVYITSNDLIAPIWLTTTTTTGTKHSASVPDAVKDNYLIAPTVFDDSISTSNSKLQVWVRKQPSCAPCSRTRGFCGKNFNYFADPSNGKVMVEIWPTGPHTVRRIDLNKSCERGLESITIVDDTSAPITPLLATVEELDFPTLSRRESILTRGRGSACCVPMHRRNNSGRRELLLVGLQHSKTPSQNNRRLPGNLTANHYLSSWYAFEPTPPFRVVAQSAWFCLGFPDEDDDSVPLLRATSWRKLELGGSGSTSERPYNCPRIHFVSGVTLAPDDPSTVIVAYGINDCFSRFVRVKLPEASLFGEKSV